MKYKFEELIDVTELKALLDSFYNATGVATAIVDIDGEIITAIGWADICTKFHRVHPLACSRCLESDIELTAQLKKGQKYSIYKCKNGLIDVAAPIIIEGIHVANLFTGQLLLEVPNIDYFKNQAKKFGYDETLYLESLKKVKIFPESQIKQIMEFLTNLAATIGRLGLAKEQQLEINEELQKSNKELDDFAYISSHDLREPLRGINNYSKFLMEDYSDKLDEEGQNMLLTISKLTVRLEQFIDSLLYYSRLGRTSIIPESVSIIEIIDDAIESFEFAIKERPTVINILDNQPIIKCDRLRTTEIYKNLIGNALKYNDKSERCINIGYMYENKEPNTPVLYVRDNGIGIKEAHIEKVFTIFKRLHPRDKFGGGTGAGLTIAKKCIELQQGKIWIDSKLGEGTTFYFTIAAE